MSARDRVASSLRRVGLAQPEPPPPPEPLAHGSGQAVEPGGLDEQRAELARRFAELQWDLGGLTYEMAIRDHFRLDVLVSQAAKLQEVDAELSEVERVLRLDDAGAAGACTRCGSLYARGASFCWKCGNTLQEAAEADAA